MSHGGLLPTALETSRLAEIRLRATYAAQDAETSGQNPMPLEKSPQCAPSPHNVTRARQLGDTPRSLSRMGWLTRFHQPKYFHQN